MFLSVVNTTGFETTVTDFFAIKFDAPEMTAVANARPMACLRVIFIQVVYYTNM